MNVQSMNVDLEATWALQWLTPLRRYNMELTTKLAMLNEVSTYTILICLRADDLLLQNKEYTNFSEYCVNYFFSNGT